MGESQTLRGRETVLVSQTERCHANADNNQIGSGKHKDGEPCALKGASTVRGGGHAIPERVNGPYSTEGCQGEWEVGKGDPNETPMPSRRVGRGIVVCARKSRVHQDED